MPFNGFRGGWCQDVSEGFKKVLKDFMKLSWVIHEIFARRNYKRIIKRGLFSSLGLVQWFKVLSRTFRGLKRRLRKEIS